MGFLSSWPSLAYSTALWLLRRCFRVTSVRYNTPVRFARTWPWHTTHTYIATRRTRGASQNATTIVYSIDPENEQRAGKLTCNSSAPFFHLWQYISTHELLTSSSRLT